MTKTNKVLCIINGTPGVGKTTITKELYKNLNHVAWLDGDWCWKINPFEVTMENRVLVKSNIIHMLNGYLMHSTIKTILFNWVIPSEEVMNIVLDDLDLSHVDVIKITLMCNEESLRQRMIKDQRSEEKILNSIERLNDYQHMDTIKIDTSDLNVKDTVNVLMHMILER